jgi:hypothetical protein
MNIYQLKYKEKLDIKILKTIINNNSQEDEFFINIISFFVENNKSY